MCEPVDILMATYNGERYIEEQLDSILGQTYKNWRLIVRDDCSNDRTFNILLNYQEMYPDKIKVLKNIRSTGSAKGNFIMLVKDCENPYAMFADQDDVWMPEKIQHSLAAMKNLEKNYGDQIPLLAYTDLEVVSQNLSVISNSFIHAMNLPTRLTVKNELIQNSVTGCTVIVNRCMIQKLNAVNDVDKLLMHDHFMGIIASVLGKSVFINEPTIKYRQHGNNSVGASNTRSFEYLKKRFLRGKKQFQCDMVKSMEQASYFLELFGNEIVDSRTKQLIRAYSLLKDKSKLKKQAFYIKNGVLKYGVIRKVMQFIWA